MRTIRSRWIPALAMTGLALLSGCQAGRWKLEPQDGSDTVRAVWVTRWDFKSPSDIARVMDNSKSAGFNTVLFQVRGAGTVLYRSRIEPWADELGGRDPGFDPLTVACAEGHKRGLSVHAWVNVLPGWHGDKPPKNPKQLYNARPDWFWRDAQGRRQPLGWYSSLNPCYPEVRGYLASVMKEIAAKYPVDGVHLDYIRFPNEWSKAYEGWAGVPDYPRDPRTIAMFRKATGKLPDEAPAVWIQWRTDQVTQLVRDIRSATSKARPKAALTVAVGSLPQEHRRNHFQDAQRWVAEGLVDGVFPMNYSSDLSTYSQRLAAWQPAKEKVPVVTGVMFDKRDPGLVSAQVARANQATTHFCAFAYNSLFERLDRNGRPISDEQSPSRAALRKQIIPQIRRTSG